MKLLFHERLNETMDSLYNLPLDKLLDLDEEVRIREDIVEVYNEELEKKTKKS